MKALLILLLALIEDSWSVHPICQNAGASTHIAHPTDCAKFIICNWGHPMTKDCPVGTLWNDFVKTCDFPRNVRCNVGVPKTTTVAPRTSRVENCPQVTNQLEPFNVPHHDCSKYCTINGSQKMTCNPGSTWNASTHRCEVSDRMNNAPSSPTRTPSPPLPTTVKPSTTTSLSAEPSRCPKLIDPANPVFIPHLNDCGKFYVCTLKGPIEFSCKNGNHWSASENRCVVPWDAGCDVISSDTSSTMEPESTSTSETTTELSNDTCPDLVDPSKPVYLPHPDRTKTYVCITGIGRLELRCPSGLRWDQKVGCVPEEITSTVGSLSSSAYYSSLSAEQSTTTVPNGANNATDSLAEPDLAFSTDVPIFG